MFFDVKNPMEVTPISSLARAGKSGGSFYPG
jgi:hypothetical protein